MRAEAIQIVKSCLVTLCRYQTSRSIIQFIVRHTNGNEQWNRRHPYDQANGISTHGYVPGWLLGSGAMSDANNSGYAGCQPSCIREGLSSIPNPARFSYLDLGCGKGRSLAIATEFPFRRIIGVEIAPEIVTVAKSNASILARRYPNRTVAEVIAGDASRVSFPDGDLVVFLYHSFGKSLLELVVSRLLEAKAGCEVFFVYENPVNGSVLDATPGFTRWLAKTVAADATEAGYAPDDSETVVVWRFGPGAGSSSAGADTAIIATAWRASLQTDMAA